MLLAIAKTFNAASQCYTKVKYVLPLLVSSMYFTGLKCNTKNTLNQIIIDKMFTIIRIKTMDKNQHNIKEKFPHSIYP